jgi:hypothetical protein
MRRLAVLAAIAFLVLPAAGCTTMSVSSHVERGLDFTQFKTFDWGPADALPTGDPRLDDDPFFQDHLLGAVEKEMAARGFVRATSAPDLLIHYHASINERIEVDRADTARGYCATEGCQVGTISYEAGTIVLDVVDTRTNRVIWRGWAQDSMEGVLDNPDRMESRINEAVKRMLERLPRPL